MPAELLIPSDTRARYCHWILWILFFVYHLKARFVVATFRTVILLEYSQADGGDIRDLFCGL